MRVPLVSIYVPAYNAAPWIARMIRSVLAQSWTDFALIVIDDGSTDGTADIARACSSDPRLSVWQDGVNRGLIARLNQSVADCPSPYYARMDAEDLMHPQRLETQLTALAAAPEAAFCASAACVIDADDRPLGIRPAARPNAWTALTRGALVHPTVLARTDFLRANPYDPACPRAEDRELFVRDRNWTRGLYLDEPLLFYRLLTDGKTSAVLRGYASERRVIRRHGPALLGPVGTAHALLRSHLKSLYVRLRGIRHSGLSRNLDTDPDKLAACRRTLDALLRPADERHQDASR